MSTRCHIIVEDPEWSFKVILYRHSDGYPDGMHGVLASLSPFVARFMQHRGWDPEYLAAHILVDQIQRYKDHRRKFHIKMLETREASNSQDFHKGALADVDNDFTGFGVCNEIHDDVVYVYSVRKDGIHVYQRGGNELTTQEEAKGLLHGEIPKRFQD